MSMNNIKVDVEQLLVTLKENREKHIKEYKEAVEAFMTDVVETLDAALNRQINNTENDLSLVKNIIFKKPQSHEEDYDVAIDMLEWSTDREISLTQNEFKQYVRDQWNWKEEFEATNSFYTGKFK